MRFVVPILALLLGSGASAAPVLDGVRQLAPTVVEVDWSDTTPATPVLYNVERAVSSAGPWTRLVAESGRDDTRRFTDADVPNVGGTFHYRIVAEYDGTPPEEISNGLAVTLDPACEGFCATLGMDRDGDGALDADDNCVALANDQSDSDGDGIGDACDAPPDYSDFESVFAENEQDFIIKVQANPDVPTYLYVPPRNYFFTQTIDIARSAPLVIHGAGRNQTLLNGPPGVSPLFRIRDADMNPAGTLIQFSNIRFQNPDNTNPEPNHVAISLETTLSGHLDLTEVYFQKSSIEIRGPGFVRLQAASLASNVALEQGLLVDHPDADVFMIGGGVGGGGGEPVPGVDRSQVSLVRQKAGRVRAYTAANGGTRGIADYWIEAGSKFGPHVLGDIRSEGANAGGYTCENVGTDSELLTSRLLYVPSTEERVDVVVKGTLAAWHNRRLNCPHTAGLWDLISYSSPGRLWLVHNAGGISIEYLVTGTAPGAHILSVNNQSFEPVHSTVDVGGTGRLTSVGDLGVYNQWCREENGHAGLGLPPCDTGPRHRFYLPDGSGGYTADYDPLYDPATGTPPDRFETLTAGVVPIPRDDIPPPLGRPVLQAPFPDMLDVSAFGAVGDGTTDDTAAIQAALSIHGSSIPNSARLFFPAGTYCVTSTLYWNHQNLTDGEPYLSSSTVPGNVTKGGNNGWWAGPGSDLAKLVFDPGCDGTPDVGDLFATQKMVQMTVQGLTFEVAPDNGVDDFKAFWVENYHQQCTTTGQAGLPDCATTTPPPYQRARHKYELPDPFSMGATQGMVFDDVAFRGGEHAHAIAIETHANNSEVLWMRSEWSDAGSGITQQNFNALNNIVYGGRFLRNDSTIGPGSGGDFSIFGATTDGGICPDNIGINLYVYGLDDSSTGCTSYTDAPGVSWNVHVSVLFENSTLSPSGAGPQVGRDRNGWTTFLHSDVSTQLSVDLGTGQQTMDSIVSLHSTHLPWLFTTPLDDTNFESDLAIALPEPGLLPQLVAGVGLLSWLVRRRRARPRPHCQSGGGVSHS